MKDGKNSFQLNEMPPSRNERRQRRREKQKLKDTCDLSGARRKDGNEQFVNDARRARRGDIY